MTRPDAQIDPRLQDPGAMLDAAWHALLWLFVANAIGCWLSVLLLVPGASSWLGELTYGRWMPVHLNFQLYGWLALPLVAWLLRVYRADCGPIALWTRTALWLWSIALTLGALYWLAGESSGKLFLDWTGFNRVLFAMAIAFLWAVLLAAYWPPAHADAMLVRGAKFAGLVLLAVVPVLLYIAANPALYPAVNPDSGGPTAASQLESVLVIVAILLLLPHGLHERRAASPKWMRASWVVFAIEALLCLGLARGDVSHHRPTQYLSLGSLLVWVLLVPAYYRGFAWEQRSRRWLAATLAWWSLLIPTGWTLFLPGVLDRLKFTDGLVAHSLLAMAGFSTSLLILVLIVLLGDAGEVFAAAWSFWAWNLGTLVYVAIFVYAGWREGADPGFTMVPGPARNLIYVLRVLCGLAMTAASLDWLLRSGAHLRQRSQRLRESEIPAPSTPDEVPA